MKKWQVLHPASAAELRDETRELALDVVQGLFEKSKRLSSRWYYGDGGSRLFARIIDVLQCYLTDCERAILETNAEAITNRFGGSVATSTLESSDTSARSTSSVGRWSRTW